jgi:glycosyltransferase involved in cell wall biosynthesis
MHRLRERQCGRRRQGQVLRCPILVDPDKWRFIEPLRRDRPYLAFCAFLDAYMHDVAFVLEAYRLLERRECDLVMVGPASPKNRRTILEAAKAAGVAGNVCLITDFLSETQLLSLYAGAAALLAPLHWDDRSRARFPSKLGDYLMSGRPVVTSAVGEVAGYFVDGRDAFVCTSDDPAAFASKIGEALESGDHRISVGSEGRRLAERSFDYRVHGRRLSRFVESLSMKRSN